MIIKVIPETDEERQRYQQKGISEIEHTGVREFMFFGNKIDSEGDVADFHEWHGAFRYLMGSLNYFYEMINDNRRNQSVGTSANSERNLKVVEPQMVKRGGIAPDVHPLDLSNLRMAEEIPEGEPTEEAGAFDEDEDRAVEATNQEISVEQLKAQEENNNEDNEIQPQGLRIVKD